MKEITINKNEAGQRLDKLLSKYMALAPKSFFYKMMRKKNITLNGKKCEGSEKLAEGDVIKLFLADETIDKFSERIPEPYHAVSSNTGHLSDTKLDILYEDSDILLVNKPSGMLSQKAKPEDVSLVEYLISYLLEQGSIKKEDLRSFRPSVCNRLDRNTSGIVACGKSLAGLQMLSEIFRDRSVHKYYQCIVAGKMTEGKTIDGWLLKDEVKNKVSILDRPDPAKEALRIVTKYEPIAATENCTLLKVTLLTGRSHQIRAHLASIGHPILGDTKYGTPAANQSVRKKGIRSQLLHSFRLEFPELTGKFEYLSGKAYEAPLPADFVRILKGEGLKWEHGKPEA